MNYDIIEQIYNKIFLNLRMPNIDLFLCGGASTKEKISTRDLLRRRLENNQKLSIFYPEDMFMELLSRKKYDLLTLETFLARNSDIIMIVCESPGSFAELGAFVNNEETLSKVVVLLPTKYKNAKSFITQGPVQYVKSINKENVIYYNKDVGELETAVNKFLLGKYRKAKRGQKGLDLISGQFNFIVLVIYFFKNVKVEDLSNILKLMYQKYPDKKDFNILYRAAIKRLYKVGFLKKIINMKTDNGCYELTTKGYAYAERLLLAVEIEKRDSIINGIRLDIIRCQYY